MSASPAADACIPRSMRRGKQPDAFNRRGSFRSSETTFLKLNGDDGHKLLGNLWRIEAVHAMFDSIKKQNGRRELERRSSMQSDMEGALIGINHLAERIQLSRRTIHRILARGEIPSLQIGRRRLIRLSEVRRWLAGCEATSPDRNEGKTV
jgi:excisionase family DNA binding protein